MPLLERVKLITLLFAFIFAAIPATFFGLAPTLLVNYSSPSGTILDSFGFFDPNAQAILNFTISDISPSSNNFAVQQTGPNTGLLQIGSTINPQNIHNSLHVNLLRMHTNAGSLKIYA